MSSNNFNRIVVIIIVLFGILLVFFGAITIADQYYYDSSNNYNIQLDITLPPPIENRIAQLPDIVNVTDTSIGTVITIVGNSTRIPLYQRRLLQIEDTVRSECRFDYTLLKYDRVQIQNGTITVNTNDAFCNAL